MPPTLLPPTSLPPTSLHIALLFLVSGFSALIYQVVWQRTLFATFGINSESVAVIVSVFMFGLGVGALAGGWLQRRFSRHLLPLFLAFGQRRRRRHLDRHAGAVGLPDSRGADPDDGSHFADAGGYSD